MLNEWKLKIVSSTKTSSWKIIATFLFRIKRLHGVFLLRYSKEAKWKRDLYSCSSWKIEFFLYMVNFIQKIIKHFFSRTITYKYMSRNVTMGLPIWQGNEHVFSCSTLKWVLSVLEQYGCPNTNTPKNDFSLTPFFSNSI